MPKLAINGGDPVCTELLPDQNTIGPLEKDAAMRVLDRGRLSGYRGSWNGRDGEFFGGPEVKSFEASWANWAGVEHAIAVNSATSGLHVACGAIGVSPGDEVICSPFSMSCSASAPLIFGASVIFADLDRHFCLDVEDVKNKITAKTKAIIVVSLFGSPFDRELISIARENNITLINDCAQATGSEDLILGKRVEAMADINISSLNFGKIINSGEGGVIATDNDDLAMRCRLYSNHGEAVLHSMMLDKEHNWDSFISKNKSICGFNMRLPEISAAIAKVQLSRIDEFLNIRWSNISVLENMFEYLPGLNSCGTREGCTNTYYCHPFMFNADELNGIHRDRFITAVKAELTERHGRENEGVPIGSGYIAPLYTFPLFGKQKGLCPKTEVYSYESLCISLLHAPNSTKHTMAMAVEAFLKVWEHRSEL